MYQDDNRSFLWRYFGVFASPTTYKNLAYLALAFPIGLMYFLFLTIGLSLGFSLLVVGIGALILLGMVLVTPGILEFERRLTNTLLDTQIPPADLQAPPGSGLGERLRYAFAEGTIIKGVVYMFMRFPFGIMALVLAVLVATLPFSMIFAPLSYLSGEMGATFNSLGETLFVSLIGMGIAPGILHFMNFVTAQWGVITESLLTSSSAQTGNRRYVSVNSREKKKKRVPPQESRVDVPQRLAIDDMDDAPPAYVPPAANPTASSSDTGTHRSIAELVEEALADDAEQRGRKA